MLLSALFALVAATPEVKFPFNNQLPPVARYGQAYNYTLNPDTFSSSETVTLSCPDLPWWLSFDAGSGTFSGTPPSDASEGDQMLNFTILAADSTGTITSDCKLALISSSVPDVSASLVDVLRDAGPTSDASSLVLSPGEEFELEFPDNYFSSDGRSVLGHYGVTSEHAPLPIWLNFDGSQRKFWGTAPTVNSEIAQAETFSLVYIESTVDGFSTVESQFNLLIGAHAFATNLTRETVNVTEGEFISYQIPLNNIYLNDHSITPANVSTVQVVGLPDWLSWDSGNYSLNGTPSSDDSNKTYEMRVTVNDQYNDSVEFTLDVNVQQRQSSTVFKSSSIGPVNVTQGQFFSYSIKDALVSEDVEISIDSNADWVSYQAGNFSLQGQAPTEFNGTSITLTANNLNKKKRDTGTTATLTLLAVADVSTQTASSASASGSHTATEAATVTSSPTSSAEATPTGAVVEDSNKKSNKKKLALILGLAIPLGLLFLIALIVLLLFCRRRRRQRALMASPKSTLAEKGVSAPVLVKGDDSPAFLTSKKQAPSMHTDEHTMVDTPEVDKEDPKDWTTPQRVSAYNFLQMDGKGTGVGAAGVGAAAAVGAAAGVGAAGTGGHHAADDVAADSAKAAAISVPVEVSALKGLDNAPGSATVAETDEAKYANVPRASWRHTNLTDRRWQDNRMSYNSIGSVSDSSAQIYPAGYAGARLPRDESSGIVHAMGSDFSSREQSMQFNTLPEESPELDQHDQQHEQASLTSDSASSQYHTATSGDEEDVPFDGESSPEITPYKNEHGGFEFRQESKPSRAERAQLRNSESVIGRASTHQGHKTQNSQSGELAFI